MLYKSCPVNYYCKNIFTPTGMGISVFQLNDSYSTIKKLQLEHCSMLKEIIICTVMINSIEKRKDRT